MSEKTDFKPFFDQPTIGVHGGSAQKKLRIKMEELGKKAMSW